MGRIDVNVRYYLARFQHGRTDLTPLIATSRDDKDANAHAVSLEVLPMVYASAMATSRASMK